ncbi:hypothetical protein [Microcoleus sp. B3-D7]|uniref:hypothetical protein n=1 Tax=Microcoleus sp. B3-D7 TaxID=2818659 RepID=UPI002FD37C34
MDIGCRVIAIDCRACSAAVSAGSIISLTTLTQARSICGFWQFIEVNPLDALTGYLLKLRSRYRTLGKRSPC